MSSIDYTNPLVKTVVDKVPGAAEALKAPTIFFLSRPHVLQNLVEQFAPLSGYGLKSNSRTKH
jgi:hypothetical protein